MVRHNAARFPAAVHGHRPVYFQKLRACRSCKAMHSFFWKCTRCRGIVCNRCLRLVGGQAVCRSCAGSLIDPLHVRAALVLFFFALAMLFLALA